jgi:carboxymethylenebutenolidase
MPATRTDRIQAGDGGEFDGHVWVPESGTGPGLLLLQEIFGVGAYLRAVAERLCSRGYTVLAPDLFWRMERNVELEHDQAGLERGIELAIGFDLEQGLADCEAALAHLRELPETGGRAGAVGFCLGGTLAYLVASRYDPDVAVSYYGSGIADALGAADGLECPILLHFGTEDTYIPIDHVNRITEALEPRSNVEVRVYRAGHAFDNHEAPIFYDSVAAREAWGVTSAFLDRELPPTGT